MPGFISQFEIPEPVSFKEKGCDLPFQVTVKGAIYVDFYDEAVFGETRNEQIENMKKLAADKVKEDLAHWHEGDKTLYFDGRDVLGDSLTAFLREKGITGSARIDELNFPETFKALYQEQIINPLNEKKSEEFRQKLEAAVEPHGPLTSVSYNMSSHGMMAGTSSSTHWEIEWKEDGSVIYKYNSSGSGKNFVREYKIQPEIANKMADFAEEHKIAALSKMDIEMPVVYDNFTSSMIVVTYDDRSVGGDHHNSYCLQCGPFGMTFKSIEDEIHALFDEIEKSGECIKNEMNESSFPGPGFMGMKQMMDMIDMNGQPGHERPLEMMGLVAVDPDAGKTEAAQEKWICKCGQENTGKFCCECGNPKTVASEDGTWECPACKTTGNRGKFCAGCGSPKPN